MVLPEHPWWDSKLSDENYETLPDGFNYTSDINDWWLGSEDLREYLK